MVGQWFGFDVFISYRHDDGQSYADDLYRKAERCGFSVFMDRGMHAGSELTPYLENTVKRCRQFVLIDTPNARSKSEWMGKEIAAAFESARRIVRIRHGSSTNDNNDQPPWPGLSERHRKRLEDLIHVDESDPFIVSSNVIDAIKSLARGISTKHAANLALAFLVSAPVYVGIRLTVVNTAHRARSERSFSIDEMDKWATLAWIFDTEPYSAARNTLLKLRGTARFDQVILNTGTIATGDVIVVGQSNLFRLSSANLIAKQIGVPEKLGAKDWPHGLALPRSATDDFPSAISENGSISAILLDSKLYMIHAGFDRLDNAQWIECAARPEQSFTGFALSGNGQILVARTSTAAYVFHASPSGCRLSKDIVLAVPDNATRSANAQLESSCENASSKIDINRDTNIVAAPVGSQLFIGRFTLTAQPPSVSVVARDFKRPICDVAFGANNRLAVALEESAGILSTPDGEGVGNTEDAQKTIRFVFDSSGCSLLILGMAAQSPSFRQLGLCNDKVTLMGPYSLSHPFTSAALVNNLAVFARSALCLVDLGNADNALKRTCPTNGGDPRISQEDRPDEQVDKMFVHKNWLIAQRSRSIDIYEVRQSIHPEP